jgi:predicted permease
MPVLQSRESVASAPARSRWRAAVLGVALDLRCAVRARIRQRTSLAVEIGTLAVGLIVIGIAVSAVDTLVGPPPVRDLARLVAFTMEDRRAGITAVDAIPYAAYRLVSQRSDLFTDAIAVDRVTAVVAAADGRGSIAVGEAVSGPFFEMFGVRPARGRLLVDQGGARSDTDVVLSDSGWRRVFARDPNIVGMTITVAGVPYTVVGVTPAAFTGLFRGIVPDFWIPLEAHAFKSDAFREEITSGEPTVWVAGHLRAGISLAQARDAIASVGAGGPRARRRSRLTLLDGHQLPFHPAVTTGARRVALVLLTIVMLVGGLTAAANLGTLSLLRTLDRFDDFVTYVALGAAYGRVRRVVLAENLFVALTASVIAAVVTGWVAATVSTVALPQPVEIRLPLTLSGIGAIVMVATAIVLAVVASIVSVGLVSSAIAASGLNATDAVGLPRPQMGLRNALVCSEAALAFILLAVTGLAIRNLQAAKSVDPGFTPQGVLVASMSPELGGYNGRGTLQLLDRVLNEIRRLPGVQSVSLTEPLPLSFRARFTAVARSSEAGVDRAAPFDGTAAIAPDYFRTLKIPVLAGREFSSDDDWRADRAVIVNEGMARRYWPGGSAVGQRLAVGAPELEEMTVVGVVADSCTHALQASAPFVYTAARQQPGGNGYISLLIRTDNGDPETLRPRLVGLLREIAPHVPVYAVQRMTSQIDAVLTFPRVAQYFFMACGAIAAVFLVFGLHGVVTLSLAVQARELGIRQALGADDRAIVRFTLAGLGPFLVHSLGAGATALMLATPVLSTFFYRVRLSDIVSVTASLLLTVVVCVTAAYAPARRAGRQDPLATLRYQ